MRQCYNWCLIEAASLCKNDFTPIMSYLSCNDDPSNNRNESHISNPRLPPLAHHVSKNRCEERRGGPDCLVKRHRNIPQRHIPTNHGEAENDTEPSDLDELCLWRNVLQRNRFHTCNGNVAEHRTHGHVTHGEEHRVLETIVGEQVLVEKQDTDVGTVPCYHEPNRVPWDQALHNGYVQIPNGYWKNWSF